MSLWPPSSSWFSFNKGGSWLGFGKNLQEGVRRQCDLEGAPAQAFRVFEILNMDTGVTVMPSLLFRSLIVLLQIWGTRSFWCNTAQEQKAHWLILLPEGEASSHSARTQPPRILLGAPPTGTPPHQARPLWGPSRLCWAREPGVRGSGQL